MASHQYSLSLIQHSTHGTVVEQRAGDGYINATALCRAAGKLFKDYMSNKSTAEFLAELSSETKLQVQLEEKTLVKQKQALIETFPGAPSTGGGSWIHPQVAVHFGQWLSAEFAVKVSRWVYDWMSGKGAPPAAPARLPTHLARYLANDGKVPPGYFSVLQETGLNLFGPLHNVGFEIPDGWVPDISVGRTFCAWLRAERGIDTDALPTYRHDYQDHRGQVDAKLYPDELLADFRRWFRTVWLPRYGVDYFKRKDVNSLPYLDRLPALASPSHSARGQLTSRRV